MNCFMHKWENPGTIRLASALQIFRAIKQLKHKNSPLKVLNVKFKLTFNAFDVLNGPVFFLTDFKVTDLEI